MRTALRPVLAMALAAGLAPAVVGATGAVAQTLPTFQQYPLRDRVFGSGGALFPDYSNPSEGGISYLTGTGAGKGAIFAAGTADFNCQQTQVPTIKVLSAPPGAKVSIKYGSFVATGLDGGMSDLRGGATTKCFGQPVKGLVVRYKGPRAPGQSVSLRVTYPTLGAWYDHVVPVPAR